MTAPAYERFGVTVYAGDCFDPRFDPPRGVLTELADASVDAIATDPPYELAFMGRQWDASGIAFNPDVWRECLRVLKPGGHLLAFGGPRTWHRLTAAVEDAGFEIRDSIAWLYASGFPKSLDVSKAIDKARDDRADIIRVTGFVRDARKVSGRTIAEIDAAFGTNGMAWRWSTTKHAPVVPTWDQWLKLKGLLGFGDEMDAEVWRLNGRKGTPGNERPDRVTSSVARTVYGSGHDVVDAGTVLAEAARWQGWGTALKPGFEPIVVARKPLAGTVAGNVQEHGVGALNIDGCRIEAGQDYRDKCASVVGLDSNRNGDAYGEWSGVRADSAHDAGRWPSNVVITHAATPAGVDLCADECVPGCPVRELDEQSGDRPTGALTPYTEKHDNASAWQMQREKTYTKQAESGGASRFFPVFRFEAKAPPVERPRVDGVAHPTVKPLALMRWLVRLVTPPKGRVLDLFAGSGTTGQACRAEGFECVLIERDETYLPLIRARLDGDSDDLFGGVA